MLTSSIPQKDTDSDPLISGGVGKVSCCSYCIGSQKYSQNISIGYFFVKGKNGMSMLFESSIQNFFKKMPSDK